MNHPSAIFCVGSIESVTGWPGAHSDEPPSTGPATIPDAKRKSGLSARCFDVSEGEAVILTKNFPRVFRADAVLDGLKAEGDGIVIGYASTFGGEPDSQGDVIAPGAFSKSLSRHKSAGTMPVMLWSHKQDQPIGRWTAMKEDRHGLLAEGTINLKTSGGRDAWEHLKAGDADGFSIGYRIPAGGEEIQRSGISLLKEIDLFEVSVVTIPSNRAARVTALKSINSKAELVDLLQEGGLSKSAASLVAGGGWKALSQRSSDIDEAAAAKLLGEIERATKLLKGI